ncbi:MAG: DNA gyrase inhibitor YacG [Candidatus Acidiferrales bacterium]
MIWQCPICHKPTNSETSADFPFCGERCRFFDLGNWASEKYVISDPALDESASEDSPSESPPVGQSDELNE